MQKPSAILTVLGLFSLAFTSSAQTNILFGHTPPPNALPGDALLRYYVPPPPAPFTPASDAATASPTLKTNFLAVEYQHAFDNYWPDVAGAIGPTNAMVMLQNSVRTQDRYGSTPGITPLPTWWLFQEVPNVFDPRIVYDPYGARWIATAAGNIGATNAAILMAVSQTSDPTTTNWYKKALPADPGHTNWADFPHVGFNKDWIVVTANLYPINIDTNFQAVRLWVFNKTNIYAGGTNAPTILTDTNALKACTLAPSLVYDNTASNMYLLTVWNTNALRVYALTGAIGNEKVVATTNYPAVPPAMAWSTSFGDNGLLIQSTRTARSTRRIIGSSPR